MSTSLEPLISQYLPVALPFLILAAAILVVLLLGHLALRYPAWRKVFITISTLAISFYFLWRLFFTLNFSTVASSIFSPLLLLAEAVGLFSTFILYYLFAKPYSIEEDLPFDEGFMPTVDILISTYNEDRRMVAANALTALSLPYPNKKVYVCDDGNREDMREMCEHYGIGYITREDNSHGKAGNINHALGETSGELILLLDADFIVKEGILKTALPYFRDPKMGMVQYPQTFYNKDPFQMLSRRFYNEQDFFMRYMEPRLSTHNATIHIGTNAVIRRTALEEIGGVPTESIAEDMATGLLLQNNGWTTLFLNKAYALGVAPFRLLDLANQRSRWARGVMQNFAAHNPLKMKNLSRTQKLLYFNSLLYWFTSFAKLIYLISPTLFMLFGVPIVRMNLAQILTIAVPVIFIQMIGFHVLVGKVRSFDESHVYDILVAPYHAQAIIKELFHKEKNFRVTPKDVGAQKGFDFRGVAPHLVLIAWLLAAAAVSIYKLVNGVPFPAAYYVCLFWTAYNLYGLFYSLRTAAPHKLQTVGDAMSVPIHEALRYENTRIVADTISYEGFTAKPGSQNSFTEGNTYLLTVERTGLTAPALCLSAQKDQLEFQFLRMDTEAAIRVARFYSNELHAAKIVDFDLEDEAAVPFAATVWRAKTRKHGMMDRKAAAMPPGREMPGDAEEK